MAQKAHSPVMLFHSPVLRCWRTCCWEKKFENSDAMLDKYKSPLPVLEVDILFFSPVSSPTRPARRINLLNFILTTETQLGRLKKLSAGKCTHKICTYKNYIQQSLKTFGRETLKISKTFKLVSKFQPFY